MKEEKAKEYLEHMLWCMGDEPPENLTDERDIKEWEDEHRNIREALEVSIEALEKQIPKKHYKQQVMIDFVDYQAEEDCYECPNCDSFLGYVDECKEESYQDNYCPNCGQKLDWNE